MDVSNIFPKCFQFAILIELFVLLFRFEATRRIRDMEKFFCDRIKCGESALEAYPNLLHRQIPILAMTADVIQATHEECLKCGMSGYVSKPFEGEQLYREVARFFKLTTKTTKDS